jgi:hypothetical protein
MVDLRLEGDLWRPERVVGRQGDMEGESSSFVRTVGRAIYAVDVVSKLRRRIEEEKGRTNGGLPLVDVVIVQRRRRAAGRKRVGTKVFELLGDTLGAHGDGLLGRHGRRDVEKRREDWVHCSRRNRGWRKVKEAKWRREDGER